MTIDQIDDYERDHIELVENYRQCFDTDAGKKVLEDLRAAYGDRLSYEQDPYHTAYKEGQRSLYLRIIRLIEQRKE